MDTELPYGPWKKVLTAQWKDYPLQIFQNEEHLLLILLFEKQNNEITGLLVMERKPFLIEGDLSKVMLAQKRDITFIEKFSKNDHKQFMLLDASPQFISYTAEELEAEITKQYGELESMGRIIKKTLEANGHVKVKDSKQMTDKDAQYLFGDPLSLMALLQGKPMTVHEPSTVKTPFGTDFHNQVVEIPMENLRATTIVGGTQEKRVHAMHVVIENVLFNHTPCLVFDGDNALSGLGLPNHDAQGLERFNLHDKPVGFSVKEYRLGKDLFIDLKLIDAGLFLSAFHLKETNVAPLIQRLYEEKRKELSSLDDLSNELVQLHESREIPRFLIQRAVRIIRVINKGYSNLFAKNISEELSASWKEEIGRVIYVNLSDQHEDIRQLGMYSLLKATANSSPSEFTLMIAFEPDISKLHPRTRQLLIDLYQKGIGFVVHDDHESSFKTLPNSLQIEIVGNDVILGGLGMTNKTRIVLRPTHSKCTEFSTAAPHKEK
ncbi:hypothetical protein KJ765_01860 [Candidatus Micrarchaeota archaeon]|nr:hypothetical protein [Candidatus Micrarchaeota archaeon]